MRLFTKIASYYPTRMFRLIKDIFCLLANARLNTFPRSDILSIDFIHLGNLCQIRIFCWAFVTERFFIVIQNQQTKSTLKSQQNSPRFFLRKNKSERKADSYIKRRVSVSVLQDQEPSFFGLRSTWQDLDVAGPPSQARPARLQSYFNFSEKNAAAAIRNAFGDFFQNIFDTNLNFRYQ